ncbi:hypothetical protein SUDANB105_02338 [Streptomyces sp. enrichment culture]
MDRLGRYEPSAATWGGVPLDGIPTEQVRERILVADHEADLFAGTLREVVCGRRERDEAAIGRAVRAAAADDIVRGLPEGLHTGLASRSRTGCTPRTTRTGWR